MKRILFFALILAVALEGLAQNCAQTLRLARSTYDQGRLHELAPLIGPCLKLGNSGFSKQERVEAYKLLTLSYIYLEEPEKADSAMISLLETDHFFEPNQALDPEEFIGLYRTFRTKPIFSWGIKGGLNMSLPNVTSNYYIANNAKGNGQTTGKIGIQIGLVFEKQLFQRWKRQQWQRFRLAPELLLVQRAIDYSNTLFLNYQSGSDPQTITNLVYSESQSMIDLNVMLRYRLRPKSKFDPWVSLGPSVTYFLSSAVPASTTRGTTGNVVSGADVDITSSYKTLTYSATLGVGARYKVGSLYVTLETRYQYGLVNVVNESKRYNSQLALDYGGVLNDYTVSSVQLLVGVSVPVFKPQKLKKKKKSLK